MYNLAIKYFFLFILLSGLSACDKSDEETTDLSMEEAPVLPSNVDLDIDDDGSPDFVIEYFNAFINTAGGIADFGVIEPYGENELLVKESEPRLFLRDLDQVHPTVADPLFWVNTGWSVDLVRIEILESGKWPTEWMVSSEDTFEFYFLGVKLIQDNEEKTGWIKLSIDESNGAIQLVETQFL